MNASDGGSVVSKEFVTVQLNRSEDDTVKDSWSKPGFISNHLQSMCDLLVRYNLSLFYCVRSKRLTSPTKLPNRTASLSACRTS